VDPAFFFVEIHGFQKILNRLFERGVGIGFHRLFFGPFARIERYLLSLVNVIMPMRITGVSWTAVVLAMLPIAAHQRNLSSRVGRMIDEANGEVLRKVAAFAHEDRELPFGVVGCNQLHIVPQERAGLSHFSLGRVGNPFGATDQAIDFLLIVCGPLLSTLNPLTPSFYTFENREQPNSPESATGLEFPKVGDPDHGV